MLNGYYQFPIYGEWFSCLTGIYLWSLPEGQAPFGMDWPGVCGSERIFRTFPFPASFPQAVLAAGDRHGLGCPLVRPAHQGLSLCPVWL